MHDFGRKNMSLAGKNMNLAKKHEFGRKNIILAEKTTVLTKKYIILAGNNVLAELFSKFGIVFTKLVNTILDTVKFMMKVATL